MAAEDGHIRLLAAEVERLHNAVAKLVASNTELRQAIQEGGDDEDRTFKTAIEDNIVTIAKYRAQAERLEAELQELRGGRQPLGLAPGVPTHEAAGAGGAASAAPAGEGGAGGQHTAQQGPGADVPMSEAGQQQQQAGGGGMWV